MFLTFMFIIIIKFFSILLFTAVEVISFYINNSFT